MTNAIQIADAIVDALNFRDGQNAGLFSKEFTAVRTLLPMYELKDLVNLKITVVPHSVAVDSFTRGQAQYEYGIDIAVQQKLSLEIDDDIEDLMGLVSEIVAFFRGKVFTSIGAVWIKTAVDPLFSQEHIQPPSVFTSVITVSFRVVQ